MNVWLTGLVYELRTRPRNMLSAVLRCSWLVRVRLNLQLFSSITSRVLHRFEFKIYQILVVAVVVGVCVYRLLFLLGCNEIKSLSNKCKIDLGKF